MGKFVEYIEEKAKQLYEHEAAEKCHIFLKEFNDPKNKTVRDHCHYTGLYRGAAHNNCNLKY